MCHRLNRLFHQSISHLFANLLIIMESFILINGSNNRIVRAMKTEKGKQVMRVFINGKGIDAVESELLNGANTLGGSFLPTAYKVLVDGRMRRVYQYPNKNAGDYFINLNLGPVPVILGE